MFGCVQEQELLAFFNMNSIICLWPVVKENLSCLIMSQQDSPNPSFVKPKGLNAKENTSTVIRLLKPKQIFFFQQPGRRPQNVILPYLDLFLLPGLVTQAHILEN